MKCIFLFFALTLIACHNREVSDLNQESTEDRLMYWDSSSVVFHEFDIEKDCFDCGFSARVYLSLSDSLGRNTNNRPIFYMVSEKYRDTLFLKYRASNSGNPELYVDFFTVAMKETGYYEGVRYVYKFMQYGTLYMKRSDGNVEMIDRRKTFRLNSYFFYTLSSS